MKKRKILVSGRGGPHVVDKQMEAACLKAYDEGERTTLRQVIEELRASLSK